MANKLQFVSKKTLNDLNKALGDLQFLYSECEKAEKAGIELPAEIKQNCIDMNNRILKFKAAYFPAES